MKFIHLNGDTVTAMAAACALTIYKTGFYTDCKIEFNSKSDTQHAAGPDALSYKDDLSITASLLHTYDIRPQCSHIHC